MTHPQPFTPAEIEAMRNPCYCQRDRGDPKGCTRCRTLATFDALAAQVPKPLADADLAELARLHAAATPGEWTRDDYPRPEAQVIAVGNEVVIYHGRHMRQMDSRVVPNHELVCAMHNALPSLLSRLAKAEAFSAEWTFVPDNRGGHMFNKGNRTKWYPESALTAHAASRRKT